MSAFSALFRQTPIYPSIHPSVHVYIHPIFTAFFLSLKYIAEVPEKVCALVYVSACGYGGGSACPPSILPLTFYPFLTPAPAVALAPLEQHAPRLHPRLAALTHFLLGAGSPGSLGFSSLTLEVLAM